jgi:hypothetical protein
MLSAHAPAKVDIFREGRGTRMVVSGVIDESAKLADKVSAIRLPLIVDLSGVLQINSLGVREWVTFVRAVAQVARTEGVPETITLVRCAICMVTQFNLVSGAAQHARIESVEAPYLCARCDHAESVLLVVGQHLHLGQKAVPPIQTCSSCGTRSLEFDDYPESYFAFLEDQLPAQE